MIAEPAFVATRRGDSLGGNGGVLGYDHGPDRPSPLGPEQRRAHLPAQVRTNEVHELVDGESITRPGQRGRTLVTGPTLAGRMVTAVLEPEGGGVFYPVTARPASRKERREYQAEKAGEPP